VHDSLLNAHRRRWSSGSSGDGDGGGERNNAIARAAVAS
jgi:hypothetical protein